MTERRFGTSSAASRAALLDAAETLLFEKGYAAVTSRKIADAAGLKPQLVHYYFRTMDDLFLEMFRRRAESGVLLQRKLLRTPQPLWALWQFSIEPTVARFLAELLALANHRKELRSEIARFSATLRDEAQAVIEDRLPAYGVDTEAIPPAVVIVALTSVSRVVMMEESLGFSSGHRQTLGYVEKLLTDLEGEPLHHYPGLIAAAS